MLSQATMEPFDGGKVLRIQRDGNIVIQLDHMGTNEVGTNEVVFQPMYVIRESQEFQRGIDPKTSMGIGDAAVLPPLIDSNVLEAVSNFDSFTEKEYKEFQPKKDPEELNYQFIKRAKKFLKGKVSFEKYFDWKEEGEMGVFIRQNAKGRYVYNATPGMDGWQVVFSKIYLPRAEEIDV
jgi:hypothetical protein